MMFYDLCLWQLSLCCCRLFTMLFIVSHVTVFPNTSTVSTQFDDFQYSDNFGIGKSGCCYSKFFKTSPFNCNRPVSNFLVYSNLDLIHSNIYISHFNSFSLTHRLLLSNLTTKFLHYHPVLHLHYISSNNEM